MTTKSTSGFREKSESSARKRHDRTQMGGVCQLSPEMKRKKNGQPKRSADRDSQIFGHIVRLMGDKPLKEITRSDLVAYREKRRGETLRRRGKKREGCKWTNIPIRDGTVRNELSGLRRLINLAKLYREHIAKNGLIIDGKVVLPPTQYEVADVVFKGILPPATERERILTADERQRLMQEYPEFAREMAVVADET
jgi:hypothetical protein